VTRNTPLSTAELAQISISALDIGFANGQCANQF